MSPLLCTRRGITLATFRASGYIPSAIQLLKMVVKTADYMSTYFDNMDRDNIGVIRFFIVQYINVKQDFFCANWLYKHRFTNVLVCAVIVIDLLYFFSQI